jgi:hypothetical protein
MPKKREPIDDLIDAHVWMARTLPAQDCLMPKVDPNYHPAFPQPDDPGVLVWRYMDLAKLLGIVMREELQLIRLDQLPDEFEGMFPNKAQDAFVEWVKGGGGSPTDADIEMHLKNFRQWSPGARGSTYVSCWRIGNFESEAMWRIYCGTNNGVAIALPYEELFASIPRSVAFVGQVTYLNFQEETFQPGNSFDLAMHKRHEFDYEEEVRIAKYPGSGGISTAIPWPTRFIQKIVIGPYAQSWYRDVIRDAVARISPALASKVEDSSMRGIR